MNEKFDVLIVGAGPAGVSTAICLGNTSLKVAIIDKAEFPREKICGDGLTLDVTNQLSQISADLADSFKAFPDKFPCSGAEIFSPDLNHLFLPVSSKGELRPMHTCKRIDFDNFMFQQLKRYKNISVFENCSPEKIVRSSENVLMLTGAGTIESQIIVGADGVNSFVARQMGISHISKKHQCVSLRTYYQGLKPLNSSNPIEMYLLKEILPGYLWIFHLGNGIANIGIGIPALVINRKQINLNHCFERLLHSEPLMSRLENTSRIEPVRGYILPLGGERRIISGERFILVGDAAGLVDPFTGEGVGNAIRSGRVAAAHIINCFTADDFSAAFNKAFDREIYRRTMDEFRFHALLRKIFHWSSLVNFLIGSAAKHKAMGSSVQQAILNLKTGKPSQSLLFVMKLVYIYTVKNLLISLKP